MSDFGLPFLEWVQKKTEEISGFSDIIEVLDGDHPAVSMAKMREVLARYTRFQMNHTAFLLIYEEKLSSLKKAEDSLYSRIYLDMKSSCSDPSTPAGAKYAKKQATQEELKMELRHHVDYRQYLALQSQVEEMQHKVSAQERYLKVLDKLDLRFNTILKSAEKEMKFLHLS